MPLNTTKNKGKKETSLSYICSWYSLVLSGISHLSHAPIIVHMLFWLSSKSSSHLSLISSLFHMVSFCLKSDRPGGIMLCPRSKNASLKTQFHLKFHHSSIFSCLIKKVPLISNISTLWSVLGGRATTSQPVQSSPSASGTPEAWRFPSPPAARGDISSRCRHHSHRPHGSVVAASPTVGCSPGPSLWKTPWHPGSLRRWPHIRASVCCLRSSIGMLPVVRVRTRVPVLGRRALEGAARGSGRTGSRIGKFGLHMWYVLFAHVAATMTSSDE